VRWGRRWIGLGVWLGSWKCLAMKMSSAVLMEVPFERMCSIPESYRVFVSSERETDVPNMYMAHTVFDCRFLSSIRKALVEHSRGAVERESMG
jgi:hypothetical protein